MAAATIAMEVLRGSIPAACYQADQSVSAAIIMVDGLVQLEMTIVSIATGTGDTDSVVFSYDDDTVPAGVDLTGCNFASFQCVCDSCEEKRCFEVIGPESQVVTETVYHVGFLPGAMILDQIRFYSPSPNTDFPLTVDVRVNGETLAAEIPIPDSGLIVDRNSFRPGFSDGLLDEDSEIELSVTSAPPGYDPWLGLSMCLLGRWKT